MAVAKDKLMGTTKTVQTAAVVQPQQQLIAAPADTAVLQDISKSLTRIIQLLTQQNTQDIKETKQDQQNLENARRKNIETGLETAFTGVLSTARAIVSPVQNILGQIIQYFTALFLGKALLNLIDWFTNPDNQDKVRSIARFLKDWWPSLVAGYILFGTGFGRVVRNLASIALRGVMLLGGVTLKLAGAIAKAIGLKRAGTALSALGGAGGGLKGVLAKLAVGAAVTAGGAMVAKNMMGGGEEQNAPQLQVPEAPPLPVAEAFSGGLIDFKTMLAAAGGQVDSKLGIFAQLFESGGLANLLKGFPGIVSGPKGIDKVPAMLTDGEFVMSRGAVQRFGVDTLEAMNAAGGGTNRPRIVNQRVYAAGGGLIGGMGSDYKAQEAAAAEAARQYQTINQNVREATGGRYIQSDYVRNLRYKNALDKIKSQSINQSINIQPQKSPTPKISISPNINPNIKVQAPTIDPRREADREARRKARAEYAKIINNPDDPRYQDAWDGKITIDTLKTNYTIKPGGMGYTPYQSRFAGARDAAFAKARGMGGFTGVKSSDFYQTNTAAKEQSLSKLTSQQRLNVLSKQGASVKTGGMGRRDIAENIAREKEWQGRGGMLGGIKRGFQSFFGGADTQIKNLQADRASEQRVKQAGAASIGRYYSSSDGKYYKDYAAAQSARQARLAKTSPQQRAITPTPKPAPKVVTKPTVAGGGMGGGRGSGAKPSIPNFKASNSSSRKTKNTYGIK